MPRPMKWRKVCCLPESNKFGPLDSVLDDQDHEFAEGVITFSMLLKGGYSTRKAGIYAFLAAALTTPIGAFIAYPIVQHLSNNVLGHMLGFVAGVLIYVSASHLLPEAREYEKKHSTLAFILGIVFALLIMFTEH